MNFFAVQSLNNYTKSLDMQMKWQKKKSSSDFTADGTTTMSDWVKKQAEEIREAQKDGSAKLSSQIRLKLNSGQKLTTEEMEYLKQNDPQTYQHVKNMEAEQASYERELKRCKTKDEVQRIKMVHTAASLSTVNEIKNNPNIPESKKLELIWKEHQKNKALEEVTREFVESGKYAQLPTEEEKEKAEKDLKEAKDAELGIEDPTKEKTPEEEMESARAADAGKENPEIPSQEMVEAEKARAALEKQEMTRMEAENTPEALKVKRAKARAAYASSSQAKAMPSPSLDVKAE